MNDNNAKSKPVDRLAPRARSAAVRQNARPLGRGQGELYKNVYLPYREGSPPFRAGRLHIRLRNIVHTVRSSGFSFTISGFSATTTHPDGSEHEVVFSEDFTDEEMVTSLFTDLEFSPLSSLKIERVPRKTVTYYMK